MEVVVQRQAENRSWYKQLRSAINALMDQKLGKHIGPAEYSAGRQAANEEAAECSRRSRLLMDEITNRAHQSRGRRG